MTECSGRALILACGNPLRGDDGVGPRIAEQIALEASFAGVEVMLAQQFLPEHAEAVSLADLVVFVDCSATSGPGEVSCVEISPPDELPRVFTHHLDPDSLLKLAGELYGRLPRRAVAVTVGGLSFAVSDQLSEAVSAAIPDAIAAIASLIGVKQR